MGIKSSRPSDLLSNENNNPAENNHEDKEGKAKKSITEKSLLFLFFSLYVSNITPMFIMSCGKKSKVK